MTPTLRLLAHAAGPLLLAAILLSGAVTAPVQAAPAPLPLTVMTQNMDEGTSFGYLATATTPQQFLVAVAQTFQEVVSGTIPARAAAVAREIARGRPGLVGLQEAALWQVGPASAGPATTVVFDSLQSLLGALWLQGLHYIPVVTQAELDVQAPTITASGQLVNVRLTDRDVILARADLLPHLSNIQAQHYTAVALIPTPVGSVPFTRGWVSVDATVAGPSFRFVTTHLEALDTPVQVAQGSELLQGPLATPLPVIVVGDFNSAAAGGPDHTATYGNVLAAGLADAWSAAHPSDAGYTYPLHAEDPLTAGSPTDPTERIDLVLIHGSVTVLGAHLVGNTLADQTPGGRWPSDHAGVLATVLVP